MEEFKPVKLNPVTHSVRAEQAILQYGVGTMVNFPDQTLTTAAPEFWRNTLKFYDERFAKALGVNRFEKPMEIAYTRFPEWYSCPKCGKFQSLKQWVAEYKKCTTGKDLSPEEHMIRHMQCPTCHRDLLITPFVTVCKNGHLNDFPWVKWVHKKANKPICESPMLTKKSIKISCSCGASCSISSEHLNSSEFENLDKNSETKDFLCEGNHPHQNNLKEKCDCYPKTVPRGSSSVYFPVVYSSLVIPPYADKLNINIEESKAFSDAMANIEDWEKFDKENIIKNIETRLPSWSKKIASEIGARTTDVERILTRKLSKENNAESDVVESVKYYTEEYLALNGDVSTPTNALGDFSRESTNVEDYHLPHIKSISLIDKVRVVKALIGFSRINPVTSKTDEGFVHIKKPETCWYPACEVRGEGIFIEFKQQDIESWIQHNPGVSDRTTRINKKYATSFRGRNEQQRTITPKFVMLHTLSHLLIKELSFECGYNIASLCERIYCAEDSEGKQMAGIFIYTASGDSEGTLGGLVRQGRADVFPRIFRKAIINAKTCSNDPVCILSNGQGNETLNLAACYACGLLPETCCTEQNQLLDRGLIVGTYDNKHIGFFDSYELT